MLLVADFESCGIAYLNTLGNGYTLSVAKKSCALGYYSFGHEVSMSNEDGEHHNLKSVGTQLRPGSQP